MALDMTTLGTKIKNTIEEAVATSPGGSPTIQNNGANLTQRPKANFRGLNLMADNSSNLSSDIQLFPNLQPDWYINQNTYPSLEWIWRHSDGYWYFVVTVLSQATSNVGNTGKKFKVYKTLDWINHIEVCSYENLTPIFANPKITIDTNGNILVVVTDLPRIASIFFDVSDNYSATFVGATASPSSGNIDTAISINVSADNRFGIAYFAKNSGSTTYTQLSYVERSAGSGGTWGTPEILGATPLRAATVTSAGAIQLFYTSTNEPIIAFLNNASATSSKAAIAKKLTGTWNIYESTLTSIFNAVVYANNDVFFANGISGRKFEYTSNSFISINLYGGALAIDANSNIFSCNLTTITSAVTQTNLYYIKNDNDTFHRAIRHYMQIGAVISANGYSTFGIYTVIPYSRQRLADAWHLVIRCDGAIFMEKI